MPFIYTGGFKSEVRRGLPFAFRPGLIADHGFDRTFLQAESKTGLGQGFPGPCCARSAAPLEQ